MGIKRWNDMHDSGTPTYILADYSAQVSGDAGSFLTFTDIFDSKLWASCKKSKGAHTIDICNGMLPFITPF